MLDKYMNNLIRELREAYQETGDEDYILMIIEAERFWECLQ